jgi:hypothetical protein
MVVPSPGEQPTPAVPEPGTVPADPTPDPPDVPLVPDEDPDKAPDPDSCLCPSEDGIPSPWAS